eukprot:gene9769-2096_t
MTEEQNKKEEIPEEHRTRTEEIVDEIRPLAYTSRVAAVMRTMPKLLQTSRGVAYASELGESFRPVASPLIIKGLYGVSWAYVLTDITVQSYHAHDHGKEAMFYTALDQTIFHSFASMMIPAAIIHQVVHHSAPLFLKAGLKSKFAPIILGLSTIPLIIHPIDHGFEWLLDQSLRKVYGDKMGPKIHHHDD